MNSQGILNYDRHVSVISLPEGINGLVAMGGNVWEWIDDQEKGNSLTAGASWWYVCTLCICHQLHVPCYCSIQFHTPRTANNR